MVDYKPGDRVRLRQDANVDVQAGVEPGAEGTVLDDRPNYTEYRDRKPTGRYYVVRFDGFEQPDVVSESALEPA